MLELDNSVGQLKQQENAVKADTVQITPPASVEGNKNSTIFAKKEPSRLSFLSKLKKIKNIEIYAAILVILVMILIYFSKKLS